MDVQINLAKEVYKDALSPAVSEVGSVVGRSVRALLSPIRGMLWGWEQIEKMVETEVGKRLERIPEDRRKVPEPEIAVPLIQALTYTAQNQTLRDMYIALLSNTMDQSKEKVVHPAFVDIIRRMDRLDALVFNELSRDEGYQMAANLHVSVCQSSDFYPKAFPEWYVGWTINGYDEFEISASLVRLSKLGILELMYDRSINGANYDHFINTPFAEDQLKQFQASLPGMELEISMTKCVVYVNEFGMRFKAACS